MLKNGSFTEGWTDLPPAAGNLINQQPNGWTLRWLAPGEGLFGAQDKASGVPECVHKLAKQLPPNEQPDGPDALILEGDTTYKIFHATATFGAELSQTVTNLQPGSRAKLVVPVLAVLYGETDPFGAESGVWVNGEGEWVNGGRMGNRKWYRHEVEFMVPDNGTAEILIRVKSKWSRPKDFFIDGVKLTAEPASTTPPQPPTENLIVWVSVPDELQVRTAVSAEPNQVTVLVPEGVEVQIAKPVRKQELPQ